MPAGPPTIKGFTVPGVPFIQTNLTDGKVQIECPPRELTANVVHYPYGNLGPAGPLAAYLKPTKFICDPAVGKFFSADSKEELKLTSMSCFPEKSDSCEMRIDDVSYQIVDRDNLFYAASVCPAGYTPQIQQGTLMYRLWCDCERNFMATYANGSMACMTDAPKFKCVKIPNQCHLPPAPSSAPFKRPLVPFMTTILPDGKVQIECTRKNLFAYGNLGPGGPLVEGLGAFKAVCDPDVGKYFFLHFSPPQELLFTTMSCADGDLVPEAQSNYCRVFVDNFGFDIVDFPTTIVPAYFPCPAGSSLVDDEGAAMPKLSCELGGKQTLFAIFLNGTKAPYADDVTSVSFFCKEIPSKCVLPPAPSSAPFENPLVPYTSSILQDGNVQIECPIDYKAYGNLGPNGPLIASYSIGGATAFVCDPTVGKFLDLSSSPPKELLLKTMSCADVQLVNEAVMNWCFISVSGIYYEVYDFPGTIGPEYFPCPSGSSLKDTKGEPMPRLSCEIGGQHKFFATYQNGTKAPLFAHKPFFNCAQDPTTTTSTTTTTTTTTEATTTTSPTTTTEPVKVSNKFLLSDIVFIITGSNVPRSGNTYPYFYKVIEEIAPEKKLTDYTIYYAKLILTECKRAQDEEKIAKNNDDCLPHKIDGEYKYLNLAVRRFGVDKNIRYNSTTFEYKIIPDDLPKE